MKHLSKSIDQTAVIAHKLADIYKNRGGIITLKGPLGAGKTTFTQNFAKALGINDKVTSPTFILAKQYSIPNSEFTLHHLDLYRLESSVDLRSLSINELTQDPHNLILIEWPEKLAGQLPVTTEIVFEPIDLNTRQITIENTSHLI